MRSVLEAAQKIIDEQAIEIQQLRKQLFGRRSEKVSKDQLNLFAQVLGAFVDAQLENERDSGSESEADTPDGSKEGSKNDSNKDEKSKNGKDRHKTPRRPLKPTRSEDIPVPDEERSCPECGEQRCSMGHTRCLVVEYQPPKVEVIEYRREKLVCRECEGEICVAPMPAERVIDRALPGPQILSTLVTNKAVDGLPLNRTKKILNRAGLDIPIRTLNRWEGFAHQRVAPVVELVKAKVLAADSINLDDTGLRVRDPTTEHGIRKGHIWVFVGRKYDPGGDLTKTEEYVFYIYAPTWAAHYPEKFLENCRAMLQGDAYRGYERIADPNRGDGLGKLLAGCCMHARRPFVQALESKDPAAAFFVERFAQLYRIEDEAKKQKLTAQARLNLRQSKSVPVMEEIRERAEDLSGWPLIKPMQAGITYFLNQWDKLIVPFKQDGRLEIDNGSAERRLRRVASGRKAWLFAGSQGGAERFADVLSLVATADAAGVDAGRYLPSIMVNIDSWPQSRIEELLPHRWRQALEGSLAEQAAEQRSAADSRDLQR